MVQGDVDPIRDQRLVLAFQQGDGSAFDELYRWYRGRVFRQCLRRLGDRELAEDATQETFARAWKALPSFAGGRRFFPWLSVIAHNVSVDLKRRSERSVVVEDDHLDALLPAVPARQEVAVEVLSERALLTEALEHLSDRHREILELREGRQWSYERIAQHQGVPVSTVETLLFRARRRLRVEFMALRRSGGAVGILLGLGARFRRAFRGWALPAAAGGAATAAVVTVGFVVGGLTAPVVRSAAPTGHPSDARVAAARPVPASLRWVRMPVPPAHAKHVAAPRLPAATAPTTRPTMTTSSSRTTTSSTAPSTTRPEAPTVTVPSPTKPVRRAVHVVHGVLRHVVHLVHGVLRHVVHLVPEVLHHVVHLVPEVLHHVLQSVRTILPMPLLPLPPLGL